MRPTVEPLSPTQAERSNWEVLSLLRFFLAMVVALTHLADSIALPAALGWMVNLGGFEAVLGFLLISGYSIGCSIKREPVGFLRRRMMRIYPVYLAAILITYLIQRQVLDWNLVWTLVLNFLFLGQIVTSTSYVVPGWSLNLEVWLYCLAPLFLTLRKVTLERLIWLSFACFCLYSLGRSLLHLPYYAKTMYGTNLLYLGFIWIAGFYLAVFVHERVRSLRNIGFLFLGTLVWTLLIQTAYRFKHRDLHGWLWFDLTDFFWHGLMYLLVFLVFWGVVGHRFQFSAALRHVFRFLGDISYPLYLVHYSVIPFLAIYTRTSLLIMTMVLGLSVAVYYACDFYSRRRKLS